MQWQWSNDATESNNSVRKLISVTIALLINIAKNWLMHWKIIDVKQNVWNNITNNKTKQNIILLMK